MEFARIAALNGLDNDMIRSDLAINEEQLGNTVLCISYSCQGNSTAALLLCQNFFHSGKGDSWK